MYQFVFLYMTKPPEFKLKPGQTDYTNIRRVPVVNCVLKFGEKILLVKRNPEMTLFPSYWNGISGFLDDEKSVEAKAKEELKEELGLGDAEIISIKVVEQFVQEDQEHNKTWLVNPVLIETNTDKIKLDWEAVEYRWVLPVEVSKYKTIPGFDKVIGAFFQ